MWQWSFQMSVYLFSARVCVCLCAPFFSLYVLMLLYTDACAHNHAHRCMRCVSYEWWCLICACHPVCCSKMHSTAHICYACNSVLLRVAACCSFNPRQRIERENHRKQQSSTDTANNWIRQKQQIIDISWCGPHGLVQKGPIYRNYRIQTCLS